MNVERSFWFLACFLLIYSSAINAEQDGPIVTLTNPKGSLVQGHMLKTELGNDIFAYQDIPYGEPPIGDRRFQLPVMRKGWTGIHQATETKQLCLQQKVPYFRPPISNYTEDCLFLSVYSPTGPNSEEKYPVMIWIHGGGFYAEGGIFEEFHPKYFTDEKILMVTLNYRLGPIGLLSTGDGVIPANLGLYDQKLAFQWVHENIEAFGGNTSNVVIAGESAGAMSVGWHLLGSKPSEYFSGAIMSSGSALMSVANEEKQFAGAVEFAQAIDPTFKGENSTAVLKFLQKVSGADLLEGWKNVKHGYGPALQSGDDFCQPQCDAFDNGLTKRVPVLMGYNSEEAIVFLPDVEGTTEQAAAMDKSCQLNEGYNIREEDRERACLSLKSIYTKGKFLDDIRTYVRFSTDGFVRPIIRQARSYSKYVPETYLYTLDYNPSMMPKSPYKGLDGVGHASDLPLLFDQHDVSSIMTETDKLMSRRIVRIWANFIKYKNPTYFSEPLLENIKWPAVTPEIVWYLNLTTTMSISNNPRNCDKLASVWDPLFQHPITAY